MMAKAKAKEANVFTLAFLDVMSCGFGAVILLYIVVLQYNQESQIQVVVPEVSNTKEKIKKLKLQISERSTEKEQKQKIIRNMLLTDKDNDLSIDTLENQIAKLQKENELKKMQTDKLKIELELINSKKSFFEDEDAEDRAMYTAMLSQTGGYEEVLTGIRLGGKHTLILLDASASMLADNLVNIIRRRNMADNEKILSEKWQRGIFFVQWIMEKITENGSFHVAYFNETARPAIPGTEGEWISGSDVTGFSSVQENLKKVVPKGGTSLVNALSVISSLSPKPDNVYLIVDGLPTMGKRTPKSYTVSSEERRRFFLKGIEVLDQNSPPINVILFPMEADPYAPFEYWNLATQTGGGFMQPQKDWPR